MPTSEISATTESSNVHAPQRPPLLITLFTALTLIAAACNGSNAEVPASSDIEDSVGATPEDSMPDSIEPVVPNPTITVAIVGNPTMEDIQRLTPTHFSAVTGIDVNYITIEEQTLREQVTVAAGSGGGQYDVVMIGPYEASQFGQNGWIRDVTPLAADDEDYDIDDLLPPIRSALSVDDQLFAVPFYGESSFVMYNRSIMAAAGITIPDAPTWDEIADIARRVDTDAVSGICLRGKPGWGDLGASLTTMVNTFGGTWWEANDDGTPGEPQISQADSGFREATEFYVSLLADAGQSDPETASFGECLDLFRSGRTAMWYDATVAAGVLEGVDSPMRGNVGYALAPIRDTAASGWLWTWALAMPTGATHPDAAWEFMSWATSKEYIELAGTELPGGWAAVPPGSRISTYNIPEYQAAASSFAQRTLDAIMTAPVDDPGTTPRPGLSGVQYVNIAEFQSIGTRCTEEISAAIARKQTLDDALDTCQAIATEVSQ